MQIWFVELNRSNKTERWMRKIAILLSCRGSDEKISFRNEVRCVASCALESYILYCHQNWDFCVPARHFMKHKGLKNNLGVSFKRSGHFIEQKVLDIKDIKRELRKSTTEEKQQSLSDDVWLLFLLKAHLGSALTGKHNWLNGKP